MTDDLAIYLAIGLIVGVLVAWLAQQYTIRIPEVVKQLYITVIICLVVFLLIEFLRTA